MIGRIYKLEGGEKFYIGSTTSSLNRRFIRHKSKSKEKISENRELYVHFRNINWENCTMTLLIEEKFESRKEMLQKECEEIKKYLDNDKCLNKNRPIITSDEKKLMNNEYAKIRRKTNPEKERKRLQEWRKKNPDKYKLQCIRSKEKL